MCLCADDFATALSLIASKRLDVMPLISDIVPLDRVNEGFERSVRGEGCKILVRP
jgi:threonine dehydrogenase-like Zn-dependent dehydrogenase